MKTRAIAAGAATCLLVCPVLASAHDIVLLPRIAGGRTQLLIKYGHAKDYEYADQNKLLEVNMVPATGEARNLRSSLRHAGFNLMLPAAAQPPTSSGITMFTARYDNGYFVVVPGEKEFLNTSKASFPNAQSSGYYFKFAKAMVARDSGGKGFDRDLKQRLEIIPLADPFSLKPGDTLPVLVNYEGRPLVGNKGLELGDGETSIAEERIPRYPTDDQGHAKLPIKKTGWQIVAIDLDVPSSVPQLADQEHYSATLSFYLP